MTPWYHWFHSRFRKPRSSSSNNKQSIKEMSLKKTRRVGNNSVSYKENKVIHIPPVSRTTDCLLVSFHIMKRRRAWKYGTVSKINHFQAHAFHSRNRGGTRRRAADVIGRVATVVVVRRGCVILLASLLLLQRFTALGAHHAARSILLLLMRPRMVLLSIIANRARCGSGRCYECWCLACSVGLVESLEVSWRWCCAPHPWLFFYCLFFF